MGQSSHGEDNGISIGLFEVWSAYSDNIPLSIILAGAFPIFVLITHYKLLKKDAQFRFAWQVYLVSLLMACVVVEKGFRKLHGNFFWGYMCGLFLVFFASLVIVLKETKEFFIVNELKCNKIVLIVEWILLLLHTVMGLYYFYILTVFGADYY